MSDVGKKPVVVIIGTGGTIAGTPPEQRNTGYEAGTLSVDDIVDAVPQIADVADVECVDVASVGSQDMNDRIWLRLAQETDRRLMRPEVSGVVVTHGTDTMEETAYFLNLVVDSDKPVVLTGAMRPSTALSADGPLNLFNSVCVAASEHTRGHGVMVIANDFIHGAREVAKMNTLTVQTFQSPTLGLLGALHFGSIRLFRRPQRLHTFRSRFSTKRIRELPRVDIVYAHSNMTDDIIRAVVACGTRGIVLAGVGNGNASAAALAALGEAAASGITVVRSTRSADGAVLRNQEIDDDALGFVVSDQLNPAKARVLLQLALTETSDVSEIQEFFLTH